MPLPSIASLSLQLRSVAATKIARWWRAVSPGLSVSRDTDRVRTRLGASLTWAAANGESITGILVLNLLSDVNPECAASGIDEKGQLEQTMRLFEDKLGVPTFVQTFKRGPTFSRSSKVSAFLQNCGGSVHVVVTGHGGTSWAHYLGKRLVPFATFLAPQAAGAQKGAVWSLSRPALLDWVVHYMTYHNYAWPSILCVSLDICQICADLSDSESVDGYVAGIHTVKDRTLVFRGPVHAVFCDESRKAVPAFVLEMGPFDKLKTIIDRVAELEAELEQLRSPLFDTSLDISGLLSMIEL